MSYFEAIILGLLQGLAEFLPISSSGHLAVAQHFFEIKGSDVLLFTVLLHIGTLVSVFIVYWRDILDLVIELVNTIRDLVTGQGLRLEERPIRKLGVMIIVATIPTAIIGLLFNDFFESLYTNLLPIGIGFIITGCLLYFSEKFGASKRDIRKMNFRNAIFIGVMQGIAIAPGISRSGSTMVGGLTCNLKRDFAVKFAFLISIPSILGSAILEVPDAIRAGIEPGVIGPAIVGMVVAAVSGLAAIRWMIRVVVNQKLKYFSYYVWALGAFVI
ncbi:MAG: undecaprenyl-diphosphate phosphatase, partial [Firmicutes bacterium]|nr:undecaprenyl-diphosphate phosphatase [Bacillota bacterium]